MLSGPDDVGGLRSQQLEAEGVVSEHSKNWAKQIKGESKAVQGVCQ
jgi:hypothetical protein